MRTVRDSESPTVGEYIGAALALIFAAGGVFGLIIFASHANEDSALVNWFGLTAALAGAVFFELIKYSVTVKRRHLERWAIRISVTPAKVNELRALSQDIQRTRELQGALSSVIELRARELLVARMKKNISLRADLIKDELLDLADQETRLALDTDALSSGGLAEEMQNIFNVLQPSQRSKVFDIVPRMPGMAGLLTYTIDGMLKLALREWQSRRARRIRLKASDLDTVSAPKSGAPAED
jgi:hypothetical protein